MSAILVLKRDRKGFQYLAHHEIDTPKSAETSWNDIVVEAIRKSKELTKDYSIEQKIVVRMPWPQLTTRFIRLPVVGKKKVDMMLPFQLEESIPFSMSKAHFTTNLHKLSKQTDVIANIVKRDEFELMYQTLTKEKIVPHLIAANQSFLNNFLAWVYDEKVKDTNRPIIHQNCLIIEWDNIGVQATMVYQQKMTGNHSFYFTEQELVEKIGQHYNVGDKEARDYLLKEAFFLPKAQWDKVKPNQKQFAKKMEDWCHPVVNELKRWLLAYRVKHGVAPEFVYITGKLSGLLNLDVYLTESLQIKVLYLDLNRTIKSLPHTLYPKYGAHACMALAHLNQSTMANLLRGEFSPGQGKGMPWPSIAFVASRVAILSCLWFFFGLLENAFLIRDMKVVTAQLSGLIKTPYLGLNKNEERRFIKSSNGLLPIVSKKVSNVQQEVKTLMSAGQIDSAGMLVKVSQLLGNNEKVDLLNYRCDGEVASFLFNAKNKDELKAVQDKLASAGLPIKHMAPTDIVGQLLLELRVK